MVEVNCTYISVKKKKKKIRTSIEIHSGLRISYFNVSEILGTLDKRYKKRTILHISKQKNIRILITYIHYGKYTFNVLICDTFRTKYEFFGSKVEYSRVSVYFLFSF